MFIAMFWVQHTFSVSKQRSQVTSCF